MTKNPLSGHTAAQNTAIGDNGLRDGDSLSSPTLTNVLEGIHGNGIIRLQDGAYGSSRNETNTGNQPGSMTKHADIRKVNVEGGLAVLDGVLYEFGGGPGGTGSTVQLGTHGTGTALASGDESMYVIYATPKDTDGHLHVSAAGGSPVQISQGLYPQLPDTHLITTATANDKIIVLGTVRCSYSATGGGSNAHNVEVDELNDKRHFLSSTVNYMVPITGGGLDDGSGGAGTKHVARGAALGITTAAELRNMKTIMASPVDGNFGGAHAGAGGLIDVAAMWVSHANNEAPNYAAAPGVSDAGYGHGPSRGRDRASNSTRDILFYAGQNNAGTADNPAIRLSGRGVDAPTNAISAATWTVTANGDSIFILNATGAVILTPAGQFPEGHIIEIRNIGSSTIQFAGLAAVVATTGYARYVWEGSVWLELFRV